MEYLEGETLAKRLDRGPLPTEQVERIGREIAEALDRAHRAGIIHRDLKPGNIILTKTGAAALEPGREDDLFYAARSKANGGVVRRREGGSKPAESVCPDTGDEDGVLGFQYAIAGDGRVLVDSLPTSNSSPLTLIVNWGEELKSRR